MITGVAMEVEAGDASEPARRVAGEAGSAAQGRTGVAVGKRQAALLHLLAHSVGRSVTMPSTPRSISRPAVAASLTVQASTCRPRACAS